MATLAFDSLRYARRLREVGVPEQQADVQAELMAEAFGFYADNLVTRDYLDARLQAELAAQDRRFDSSFARQERFLFVHSWMLGIIMLALVVPQLQAYFS